jgi:hypothetical protein
MRCTSAQRHLTTAGERLGARTRAAAERHVAGCAACREELRLTRALFTALGEGSAEAPVPVRLEQATLRAVRIAAAEEAERPARWWTGWSPVPAVAVAAVAVVAITVTLRSAGDGPSVQRPAVPARIAARPAAPAAVAASADSNAKPRLVAQRRPIEPKPAEPPRELAERPDLFIDLPILRHMEKLEHFEQIETTSGPEAPADPAEAEGQTNG